MDGTTQKKNATSLSNCLVKTVSQRQGFLTRPAGIQSHSNAAISASQFRHRYVVCAARNKSCLSDVWHSGVTQPQSSALGQLRESRVSLAPRRLFLMDLVMSLMVQPTAIPAPKDCSLLDLACELGGMISVLLAEFMCRLPVEKVSSARRMKLSVNIYMTLAIFKDIQADWKPKACSVSLHALTSMWAYLKLKANW